MSQKLRFRNLETVKVETRTACFQRDTADNETRTIELAISSEQPVPQWFGREVLEHSTSAIRMERIERGIPLLVQHDQSDHVGILESARLDKDKRLRGVVRFGRSQRAEEIFQDVKDGIRKDVSVGYVIFEREQSSDDDGDVELVTSWMPREVSLVSVPADASVGVGRSDERVTMKDKETPDAVNRTGPSGMSLEEAARVDAIQDERRVAQIGGIADQWESRVPKAKEWAAEHIAKGLTGQMLFDKIMAEVNAEPEDRSSLDIGLTEKETKRFSISRAYLSMCDPTQASIADFERECSNAVAKQSGRTARGIFLPMEIERREATNMANAARADWLATGSAGTAPELVGTFHDSANFIDALRANSILVRNSMVMRDLVQNIDLPKLVAGASGWVAEGVALADNAATSASVQLAPKTVGSWQTVTHRLLVQGLPSVDTMLLNDIAQNIGTQIDIAGFGAADGTGSIPRGIEDACTVASQLFTVTTTFGGDYWVAAVGMETAVGDANALTDQGNAMYASNYTVGGTLKTTSKDAGSGQFVAAGNPLQPGRTLVNGYTQELSTNAGANNWFFGTFANWVIGFWGPLDLLTDPYSLSKTGSVILRGMAEVDENARYDEAFAMCTDA